MGTKGVGCVGRITKNCHVGKLCMAWCDLKHEELDSFIEHSDGAKVRNLYLCVMCVCMVFMVLINTTVLYTRFKVSLCQCVGYV